MRPSRIAITATAAALAALAVLPTGSSPSPAPEAASTQSVSATAAIPKYDHVVIVLFENKNYSSIKGSSNAPYLNKLAAEGTLFTKSYGLTHPSQPNYIRLFSGATQGITNNTCKDVTGPNLGQQLVDKGISYRSYSEGLPSAGYRGCSSGRYYRKHAPAASFPTVSNSTYHVPFSQFPTDYSKLPTVSFVTPDMCSDMHDCSIGTGDNWMKNKLGGYAEWAKTHNSLLIQTFDEDSGSSVNQIFTTFTGQHVKAGYQSTTPVDHYTILRTLEDMYGLAPLGNAANKSPITDVWTTPTDPTLPAITDPANQSSTVGTADSLQLSASGGTAPYSWSATGLPPGLSIDTATGLISGTPTAPGTFTVTVDLKDSAGKTDSATFTWSVSATGGSVVFSDDFESDRGWQIDAAGTDTATTGVWEVGDPEQTLSTYSDQVKQLGTTVSGIRALSTGAAAGSGYGANDLDGGRTTAFSPLVALPSSGALSLKVSYNVAHGDNSGPDDYLRVRVLDGTTPTTVFEKTGAASEVAGAWRTATVDLSAFAGKTVRVYVEAVDAGTASLFEAQIDDLTITTN
ncbi:alkaline phosphatase family protein [Streptomyces sp. NPDC003023]|uniref:alkaline phosphatase family protein n=1 Tax=Streptomyces sp. NPDC003023 TaxID=3364675 RepID=UPI0036AEB609